MLSDQLTSWRDNEKRTNGMDQRFRSLLSLALAFLIHLIRPLRND